MVSDFQNEYQKKLISAEEAAGLVKSGMWVDYGAICGFPSLIDEKLAQRVAELKDVKIRAENSQTQLPKVDPNQEHFIHNSWFFSRLERGYHVGGACSYIPFSLGEGPRIYREWIKDDVDITFIEVTPMNDQGFFNFGASITRQKAACEVAKKVVVEVNETMPWLPGGYDEVVHISQVYHVVENHEYRIPEFAGEPITPADEAIAGHIASLIKSGSTVQLGVGAIPSAVGRLMIKQGLKDLGIHSEVFNDAMLELIEAGVVNCSKKNLNQGRAVHCFAAGSQKLYKFMDKNRLLAGFPVDYTNNPYIIAQNENQIAINSALRVDLRGQVCSESVGFRHISGTGGQLEFTRGAYMSPGGKAFICLRATRTNKEGKMVSSIVPNLEQGDMVTVPATDISYVVTEFGAVNLKGKTCWQRAKAMISLAHPNFRAELEDSACKMNLITKGTRG